MTTISTATLLLVFLRFLVSLTKQGNMAKMTCLVTSVLSVLLSIEPAGALLPWVAA